VTDLRVRSNIRLRALTATIQSLVLVLRNITWRAVVLLHCYQLSTIRKQLMLYVHLSVCLSVPCLCHLLTVPTQHCADVPFNGQLNCLGVCKLQRLARSNRLAAVAWVHCQGGPLSSQAKSQNECIWAELRNLRMLVSTNTSDVVDLLIPRTRTASYGPCSSHCPARRAGIVCCCNWSLLHWHCSSSVTTQNCTVFS